MKEITVTLTVDEANALRLCANSVPMLRWDALVGRAHAKVERALIAAGETPNFEVYHPEVPE